jgi:hypothetical protein
MVNEDFDENEKGYIVQNGLKTTTCGVELFWN